MVERLGAGELTSALLGGISLVSAAEAAQDEGCIVPVVGIVGIEGSHTMIGVKSLIVPGLCCKK